MQATTTTDSRFDTARLITSDVATPELTRPHLIRQVDLYFDGDQQGGYCIECDAYGELNALRDLPPSSYGCMPGIAPFGRN